MVLKKIYHPQIFHSNLKRRKYFENWLFKLVSDDRKSVLVIIPVLILGHERICYIQILDGISGETYLVQYPISRYSSNPNQMLCQFADSHFTSERISLDINQEDLRITGEVQLGEFLPFPSGKLTPGLLSYFSFVPLLESYLNIISLDSPVSGTIAINEKHYNFNGGSCCIEKSWGRKYPDSWLWIHCHTFDVPETSFFLSASPAKVFGKSLLAILCYIRYKGEFFNLSFYHAGRITKCEQEGKIFHFEIAKKEIKIDISVVPRRSGSIKVPTFTNADWLISESSDATLHLNLFRNNELVVSIEGEHSGFDLVGDITSILKEQLT